MYNQHRKNIFIIFAEGFDKGWRGAYARLSDITSIFIELGYDVTLIKAKTWYQNKNQIIQENKYKGRIVNTPFVGGYSKILGTTYFFRKLNRIFWKIKGEDYYSGKLSTGWYNNFINWWNSKTANEKPDYIWAICTSNLNNILVGDYLSKKYECPFIIEFQDPPSAYPQNLDQTFEKILNECDAIVTVTESYKNYLIETYRLDSTKLWLMYLTFKNFKKNTLTPVGNDKILFLHGGSLYDEPLQRNALDLINGFIRAGIKNPKVNEKVQIIFLGPGEYFKKTKKYIVKNNLSVNIIIKNDVTPEEFTHHLSLADILVVIKFPTKVYDAQIPGKLFQYLAIKKPILGLMRKESEAAKILENTGLGWVIEPGNIEAISEFILKAVTNENFIVNNFNPDSSYINKFSYKELENQIGNLLRTIT